MNMRFIKVFGLLLSMLIAQGISAQIVDTVNQVDANGRKQGYWIKYFPNGKVMYRGTFKNDQPIGQMERFFEDGKPRATMIFSEDGNYSESTLFFENGKISAHGFYNGNIKDSIWTYYSYYTDQKVSSETYEMGVKNGPETVFYPNGEVSEIIPWKQNVKDGAWLQFFEDGKKKLEAKYQFNRVNGLYILYYPNGMFMVRGNFIDDRRNGKWLFYDEMGKIKYELNYEDGKPLEDSLLSERDEDYFKMIEENMGKFEDPTPEDFFPGGGRY